MAKNQTYTVTVGPKAYSFNDQVTGISIAKGEEKVLTTRQYNTKKIRKAIAAGHLILIQEKSEIEKYSKDDVKKLDNRLKSQFTKGMELSKLEKAYTLEELKLIGELHEIEADENDTVLSMLESLLEDFEESKEKKQ